MTIDVAPCQSATHPDQPARATIVEVVAYVFSVAIVFTYAQGWAAPLTGWVTDPSKLTLLKVGYLPAYAMTALLCVAGPGRALSAAIRTPLTYSLVVLAAASCLWSIDGDATLRRVVALFFTTLAGSVLASRWSMRQLCEIIAAQFAVLMVLSVVFAVLPPRNGIMTELFPGAWRGVWTEKNGLGAMMVLGALSSLAAAVLAPRRRWWWVLAFLGCVALVLLSRSKTSLLALMLAVGALGGAGMLRRGPAVAVVTSWLIVAGTILIGGLLALEPDAIFGVLNKDATLTGRTEIWSAAIRQGLAHNPLTGFGYGVLWDHRSPFDPASWIARDAGFTAGHAHNGWLEVWLGLGFLGLTLWTLAYLGNLGRVVWSAYTSTMAYATAPFFLVFSIISITEVSILDYHDIEWMIYVAFATKLAMPRSVAAAGPSPR